MDWPTDVSLLFAAGLVSMIIPFLSHFLNVSDDIKNSKRHSLWLVVAGTSHPCIHCFSFLDLICFSLRTTLWFGNRVGCFRLRTCDRFEREMQRCRQYLLRCRQNCPRIRYTHLVPSPSPLVLISRILFLCGFLLIVKTLVRPPKPVGMV